MPFLPIEVNFFVKVQFFMFNCQWNTYGNVKVIV